jgi:hypothetical protein
MTIRLAVLAAWGLALAGCSVPEGGYPVYVGDQRLGALGGPGTSQAAAPAATECQQLAQRAVDASLTEAQRRAASDYGASIGC